MRSKAVVRNDGRQKWFAVLSTAAVFLLIRAIFVAAAGYGVADLARFEEIFRVDMPDWYGEVPLLLAGLRGDGQAFWALAIDPFGAEGVAQHLAFPVYRYSRIGLSIAAWLITAGQPSLVPIGILLVSSLAVGMLAYLAYMRRERFDDRWAWLLVANPALILGFVAGTAEPLGMALLALGLKGNGIGWLVGAVRPSFLITYISRWRLLVSGAVLAVLIRLVGMWIFGGSFSEGGSNLALPITGYIEHPSLAGFSLLVVALFAIGGGIRSRTWSWVAAGALVCCFGPGVLVEPVNSWRVSGMLWVALASDRDIGSHRASDGSS